MSWYLRYVIKCHLEHLKTHCRGVLGLYLIAPPVMMSYSSRDHGLKVGRLVAPHNNSRDQQQQQRQVNMELLNPYDSDSKALLHPSQKCFPLSCHLPVPTASGKSHLKSPFFCPSTPLPCHLLPQETTLTRGPYDIFFQFLLKKST